jgi:hypothetical protein
LVVIVGGGQDPGQRETAVNMLFVRVYGHFGLSRVGQNVVKLIVDGGWLIVEWDTRVALRNFWLPGA